MLKKLPLATFLIWFILVTFWEITFRMGFVNESFITSPSQILQTIFYKPFQQDIGTEVVSSLSLFFSGLILGYLLSYLIFFIGFLWKPFLDFFRQINLVLKYLPPPLVIPIGILIFGISDFTKIFVIALSVFFLYLNYLFGVMDKEESGYRTLQKSWQISPIQRYFQFFLPISNNLNYRILPSIIIWAIGVTIFVEISLGSGEGIGGHIADYQQVFNINFLYASIVLLMLLAFSIEKLLFSTFARFRWDVIKIFSTSIIVCLTVLSLIFQTNSLIQDRLDSRKVLITYSAQVNLPIMVYIEKFNNLNLRLEMTGTGIDSVLALSSDDAIAAGFSDLPNALASNQKNPNHKIISQVSERPDHPTLFLVSTKDIVKGDFSAINDTTIGYYPDNNVVKEGLSFVLFLNKVKTNSVNFTTSENPQVLSQNLINGSIQSVLTVEPYATIVEEEMDLQRVNKKETVISGIKFDLLPLAALLVDIEQFNDSDLELFVEGINKSIDYIRENTNDQNLANSDLQEIMKKYDIHENSFISYFEKPNELNPENLTSILNLINTYAIEDFDFSNIDKTQFYLKP